jgi:outer membrane receptor protein involved in Fe transport
VGEVRVAGDRTVAELRQSPYPVTVIDVKKYAGRATDLNELLDRTAGVKIRQSGGVGSTARISIRGIEGRRIAVFIDSHPVTAPDGSFGINDLPLQLIERIEIYKGVVPARLGGDGLGSAVNVVLRDRQQSYADMGYSISSYNTHRAFTFNKYVDRERGISIGAGAIANYADNDFSMPRTNGPPVRRDHDNFRNFLAGAALELTKAWFTKAKLETGFVISRKELQGIPAAGSAQFNIREARFVNRLHFVGLELEKVDALPGLAFSYDLLAPYFLGNFRDTAAYVYDFDGNRMPSPYGRGEDGRGPNDSRNRRLDLHQRLNVNYALGPTQAINLNSDLVRTFDRPSDPAANAAAGVNVTPFPGNLFRSVTGLSHEGHFFGDRLIGIAGIKHFYLWSEGTVTSLYDIVSGTPDRVSQQQQAIGWNVAARYKLTSVLLAKASYERAARLPVAEELVGDGFRIQGSTSLEAERSDNVTAGFYFDQFRDGKRIQIDVTGFASRVHNLITLGGTFTPNYANVGHASIRGVEVEVKADVTRSFYVYTNGTFQDLRNETELIPGTRQPNYLKGLVIPNVPRLFASWGAELHGRPMFGERARTRLFYDASFVDRYYYEYQVSENQSRILPRYLVQTVGLQQTFAEERYSLNVEAVNLGDVHRYDEFNVPLPGRTYRVFFRMTFL